ncbi:hypothetical protein ACUXAV_000312 [Cupriavidus metallidurans]|uniref:hypothetical protein n=1 Tax=Cupriavidus metallidurans TaxID=119219 RepID=UPI00068A8040|nr:hypothetical protein [Cupriavidus metallidurans]MDE4918273.1 hypothetical protein [Cupriavidus metallidurans]
MQIDLNDPEQVLKAFNDVESGKEVTLPGGATETPPAESEADKAAREAAEAAAAAEAEAAAKAASAKKEGDGATVDATQTNESNAEGVLARDGKNVIPFSVLKSERERATRAEQLAKEATDKVAELQAQLAAGNQGAKPGESARTAEAATEVETLTEEELAVLKEDFPTQYKVYMAQQATIKALQAQQQQVEQERQQQQTERQRTQEEQVRDAIDATPKLAHIQATDPERFAAAQQFDALLRGQPKWAGKPLAERFARVVELVEMEHGAIEIPGAKPQTTTQKTPEELKKEAEAAAAKAKPVVPTSLSDFPAGSPPANSEQEALESLTPLQLADKMAKMNPAQLEAYLNTLE